VYNALLGLLAVQVQHAESRVHVNAEFSARMIRSLVADGFDIPAFRKAYREHGACQALTQIICSTPPTLLLLHRGSQVPVQHPVLSNPRHVQRHSRVSNAIQCGGVIAACPPRQPRGSRSSSAGPGPPLPHGRPSHPSPASSPSSSHSRFLGRFFAGLEGMELLTGSMGGSGILHGLFWERTGLV
jgi:hypothetical protein